MRPVWVRVWGYGGGESDAVPLRLLARMAPEEGDAVAAAAGASGAGVQAVRTRGKEGVGMGMGMDVDVGVDVDGDASGADGEEGEEVWGIANDAYFQPGLSFFSERGGMIDTFVKMGTLMARRDSKVM
jgi:hypothetical protein